MSASLEFLSGSLRGRSVAIEERPLLVGRQSGCQVTLTETKISREHARIVKDQDQHYLEDLDSTNGTFLNGRPVKKRRQLLRHNDQIHFAEVLCVYRFADVEESAGPGGTVKTTFPLLDTGELPQIVNTVKTGADSQLDLNAQSKLRAVLEMLQNLGGTLQLDTLLQNVLEGLFSVFPQTDRGYVLFPEGNEEKLVMRATRQREESFHPLPPLNLKLPLRAIITREAILSRDDSAHKNESVLESYLRSMMCIPLIGPLQKVLGAVYLEANDGKRQFEDDDLRTLVSVGRIAGQAVEYAHMHEGMMQAQRVHTAELQRSNSELQQFAYAASHDLQEPLRAVGGYCQLLKELYHERLDEQGNDFIDRTIAATQRMQSLITGLLDYSRVTTRAKEFQEVDCNQALATALQNLELSIHESDTVVEYDAMPKVRGDSSQLVQVLQNLIGNAIKYRKPGQIPRVKISASQLKNEWEFAVQDNGIGIDAKYSTRVFEVFQRLHGQEVYGGAGIGLAICKKVVDRHHGRIWFESVVGEGCTFYFTLPR